MKNIYIALIGLLIVASGATALQLSNNNKSNNNKVASSSQENATDSVQNQYMTYKGATYDRMFLAGMIAHHTGAVEMANLALTSANHQQLKDFANEIITAQTSEMTSMKSWQTQWNYPASSGEAMQDHSAMMMEDDMAGMAKSLKGKTGDDFDKTFLSQMIGHHQQAVAMSKPAATNAQHQEVKDLAAKIISAQTGEIDKMQMWQAQWGYSKTTTDSMSGMSM